MSDSACVDLQWPTQQHSLRHLAAMHLNWTIQQGSHDSKIDAIAALRLVKLKLQHGPFFGTSTIPWAQNLMEALHGSDRSVLPTPSHLLLHGSRMSNGLNCEDVCTDSTISIIGFALHLQPPCLHSIKRRTICLQTSLYSGAVRLGSLVLPDNLHCVYNEKVALGVQDVLHARQARCACLACNSVLPDTGLPVRQSDGSCSLQVPSAGYS